jgi:acyl-CoA reductase-like NAD-dependent aldehyde dehydrogenase
MQASEARSTSRRWVLRLRAAALLAVVPAVAGLVGLVVAWRVGIAMGAGTAASALVAGGIVLIRRR